MNDLIMEEVNETIQFLKQKHDSDESEVQTHHFFILSVLNVLSKIITGERCDLYVRKYVSQTMQKVVSTATPCDRFERFTVVKGSVWFLHKYEKRDRCF